MRHTTLKHRLAFLLPGALALYVLAGALGYEPRPFATAYARTASFAIAATEDTALSRAVAPEAARHPGQSGFELILRDAEALRIRLAMIAAAQKSLDIQYYSIQDDATDQLLMEALLQAAARGVRIRILIDDITLRKSDRIWALLDSTRSIELRVFNPFATRDESFFSRAVNFFGDISRFNKRMHNKLFVVDNQLAVIGGRNLGDAYFGTSQDFNFRDVDILCAGPVVPAISASFDAFWNGEEAYPLSAVARDAISPADAARLRDALSAHWQAALRKGEAITGPPLAGQLASGQIPLLWADATLAADEPAKIEPSGTVESAPGSSLQSLLDGARHEFIAVSPYFVPGEDGIALLQALAQRGVKIRILTNSLGSTDVVAVHAGYRRYRKEILAMGAELYELKPQPGRYPRAGRFSSSSRASLHTKVYIVDRDIVVVGTFNLDPRSIHLNTEIGLVIRSPELASQLVTMFDRVIAPSTSFRVLPAGRGLIWAGEDHGQPVRYDREPEAGFWRPIEADLLSLLPWGKEL